MSVWKAKVGGLVTAAVAAAAVVGFPAAASAQGLIEFLWGGEPEYGGGKRQVVSFNPQYKAGQIIVSFGDRRLYHITKAGQAMSYPIAIPREQSRWQGATVVSSKRENPDWRPTPDMLKENPRLPSWVPGGHPMNPLGVRALYLGSSLYRIHGTDAPWTIGQDVSKGCIRMFNEDVMHLYPKVPTGTKVTVTWERFKTGAVVADAEEELRPEEPVRGKKAKTRSVASAPKNGFFVKDEAADEVAPEEGMVVHTLNPETGKFDAEEVDETAEAAPAPSGGGVTKYGRRVGGSVSRAASVQ
ncbi:L,D-transpeptidase [Hyphomicrobium sp. CS1GBMeth3]|uniref:L,D-transpeptidase n=1 Tax=Hyphomicrobium sp. CS1GBMeth3 TaxID=1892845 RepID=UPI0009314FB2|nr:L,D-transpeptidase [Hyphomicrobium sp. CS1GBMeth3]